MQTLDCVDVWFGWVQGCVGVGWVGFGFGWVGLSWVELCLAELSCVGSG